MTTPDGVVTELVHVHAGPFEMGSEGGFSNERPVHTVELDGFYIDKYEVTNAQYEAFVTTGDGLPSDYADDNSFNGPQHPVVGVSWLDAQMYCGWAGLRLPTEAEWEKAARGSDGRTYPWGEGIDGDKANYQNSGDAFDNGTTPVGHYPDGVSPYGAFDLAGNVWEWVWDRYDGEYYASSPSSNPQGPSSGSFRVLQGGARLGNLGFLRAAYRRGVGPAASGSVVGFRCAQTEGQVPATSVAPRFWGEVKSDVQ